MVCRWTVDEKCKVADTELLLWCLGQQIMRLPDGRLHLISTTTPRASQPSTVTIPAQTTVTLPQTPQQPLSTFASPRTVLIGGQRVILTSLAATGVSASPQLVVAGNSLGAAGTQVVSINSTAGSTPLMPTPGRPRFVPAMQQPTTLIRMPSGQQLLVRPSQLLTLGQQSGNVAGSTLMTGSAAAAMFGISPGGTTLLSTTALSPPNSPATGSNYAITPQVVQQGNVAQCNSMLLFGVTIVCLTL